jgi:hypothetical protein
VYDACATVTSNPYAQPGSAPPPTRLRLFTATAVAVHMFVFPPAAVTMAIANHRRLGDGRGALKAAAQFGLPTLALLATGAAVRARGVTSPQTVFVLAQLIRVVLTYLVFQDQRPLVQAHFEAGGLKARWVIGWVLALPAFVLLLAVYQYFGGPIGAIHQE